MPKITLINTRSQLNELINTNHEIQKEPFIKLLKIVQLSLKRFRRPNLIKFVIYLPETENSPKKFLDELRRVHNERNRPFPLYHWAREYKTDSSHFGFHYHFIFISERRGLSQDYQPWAFLKHQLEIIRVKHLINNFSESVPISNHLKRNDLKKICSNPSQANDLCKWLSYDCKKNTKHTGGRNYGSSRIPASVEAFIPDSISS